MKLLPIASLALILALTGCASDKYYDLGFRIGSSAEFVKSWNWYEKNNGFLGEDSRLSFGGLCERNFNSYVEEAGDNSYSFPSGESIKSLVQGCRDGYVSVNP